MPLTNSEMRAIEIMIEQMERLEPQLRRARNAPIPGPSSEEVVRAFYDENTRMGQFELNYLRAIGKNLAPDPDPQDMIVTTII